jgi:hypothetical protein
MILAVSIAGVVRQSLQLEAQVTLASLGLEAGRMRKVVCRRSVCFCNQSGGGVSIRLFT